METQDKKLIVVLGMHRSGTSALTRGLKALGVDLGDRLLTAKGDNAKGFWEDVDLNALNIEMLGAIGSDWHHLATVGEKDVEFLIQEGYLQRAIELMDLKCEGSAMVGLKDPRVAKLMPFWEKVFDRCQFDVSYLLALRHPLSVAKSLSKRNGFDMEKSYFLWLSHVVSSLVGCVGKKRVLVDYDLLMRSPEIELSRIASRLNLEIDPDEFGVYISEFLEDDLRSTVYDLDQLSNDFACPALVKEVYATLLDVALDKVSIDDAELKNKCSQWKQETEGFDFLLRFIDKLYSNKATTMHKLDGLHEKVVHLNRALSEKDEQLTHLNRALSEKDEQLAHLNRALSEKDEQLALVLGSRSWRLTNSLRLSGRVLRKAKHAAVEGQRQASSAGGYRALLRKAYSVYRKQGLQGLREKIQRSRVVSPTEYQRWIDAHETLDCNARIGLKEGIDRLKLKPKISILMPVYNTEERWLRKAINSVIAQVYENWELCIADDASSKPYVKTVLNEYAALDKRIKICYRESNGHISECTNSALALASGEYIALMDNDDELAETALYWVAREINDNPDADLIYSDEDKISTVGDRFDPYFKCDWNKDLFLSQNMICHLGVYRTRIARQIGGFRKGYEGAQDWDFALRFLDEIEESRIRHIPRVLYHWRVIPGSTASGADEKPYAIQAAVNALNDYLKRNNVDASAVKHPVYDQCRVIYSVPDPAPLVSLIIPTRNGLDVLRLCVESIIEKTTYKNFEIIIIDNGSDDPETIKYLGGLVEDCAFVRVLRDDSPFNYSALNNRAVKVAKGSLIGLVNNDIEVISPGWLEEMVSQACRPEIGAVGARLWYPNDTLQHGGVIIGLGGVAGHSHKYLPKGHAGFYCRAVLTQSLSAVTAACLLIRKSIYEEVGGLDERNLTVAFNDVDFCLRVREAGYKNLWTPYAELYHHESVSRGAEDNPEKVARFNSEVEYMKMRWEESLLKDPYYSPNLTLDHENFSLAWPARV